MTTTKTEKDVESYLDLEVLKIQEEMNELSNWKRNEEYFSQITIGHFENEDM